MDELNVFNGSVTASDTQLLEQMQPQNDAVLDVTSINYQPDGFWMELKYEDAEPFSVRMKFSLRTTTLGQAWVPQYDAKYLVNAMKNIEMAKQVKFPYDYLEGARLISDVTFSGGYYHIKVKSFVDVPLLNQLVTEQLHD